MISESITRRFSTMTNETGPHDEGAAEIGIEAAARAAITTADPAAPEAAPASQAGPAAPPAGEAVAPGEPAPPAEPPPPSFDDMGLHPDVRLALDDMGYFRPTPVQTAVYKPV